MFVVPAFEIHGGVAGLYDYGPPGCALKENILQLWRQHFVLEDNMLQIECTTLTPYSVLKASGHVDRFEDLMVKDVKTGECYRADKLLEDFIENLLAADKTLTSERREELRVIAAQADAYEPAQLHRLFGELGIKSPGSGAELTEPFPFNLMFQTSIGPTGNQPGFLRPETAQGMFVNFRRLYDYNNQRMPMAVAQIGTAYRNEIAPKGGLIRVREFTMAEIEYFVNPKAKDHVKFGTVKDLRLNLFPAVNQVGDGKFCTPTVGEAVASKLIDNQTLAYFMARTAMFMFRIGIKPEGLRFRQHLKTEMAHYACGECTRARAPNFPSPHLVLLSQTAGTRRSSWPRVGWKRWATRTAPRTTYRCTRRRLRWTSSRARSFPSPWWRSLWRRSW
jgi:glycyl-tRNA synthetase